VPASISQWSAIEDESTDFCNLSNQVKPVKSSTVVLGFIIAELVDTGLINCGHDC
jgi:hypothetical protein